MPVNDKAVMLGPHMVPMRQGPPSVRIHLTPEQFHEIHDFAFKTGMSVSQVGQLALRRLMCDVDEGVVPEASNAWISEIAGRA